MGEIRVWGSMCLPVLLFSSVLYFSYKIRIAPVFAYSGLNFRPPDLLNYGMALLVVFVVSLSLPHEIRRASDFLLWMLFLVAAAPSILLPQYMTHLSPNEASILGVVVGASMIISRVCVQTLPKTLGRFRPAPSLTSHIWVMLGLFTGATYLYTFTTAGAPGWVSIFEVYDVRADFTAVASGSLIGYLTPIQANVVNPIFIARGLFGKRPLLLAVGFLGQALLFMTDGQKGTLFSTVGILGIVWLYRGGRSYIPGQTILYAGSALALISLTADAIFRSFTWTTLFVRRFLVVPGALTVAYVTIFADRPKTYFGNDLGKILPFLPDSPYTTTLPSFIVGSEFTGDPTTNANVNIFGHGYLGFGYAGMVIIAVLFAFVLCAVDAATEDLPGRVVAVIFFKMSVVLSSASLFTASLTHGLIAGIIICALLPRDGWGEVNTADVDLGAVGGRPIPDPDQHGDDTPRSGRWMSAKSSVSRVDVALWPERR